MKLTNKLGLPQPIVDAVKNDSYSKGESEISVTGLLRPARQAALEAKHWNDLSEDASERIWSLLGQVVHGILERADTTGIAERRLSIKVNGWTVSGQMDRYIDGVLQDFKFVTAWKFKDNKVPLEYEQQLNCYAEILRQNGHPVKKLEIVGILRDWSKMEAARDPNYPQSQVMVLDVPMWIDLEAKGFLMKKVMAHQASQKDLPECSSDERWEKPTLWAVMKKGRERAVKLYGTEAEASAHAESDKTLSVEKRQGASQRCQFYCSVAKFCSQYQATIKSEKGDDFL